ncbi:hypothetical protein EAS64_33850 [Trebonia kvetii]|uniref:Uncharacterized protein n=1 Tax=Trebonia kvetii TaxID=2480626 RepID=A0A6P2BSY6_9ACTN|nr:hypothetical protein [Trebonia kvetii]TVZ01265.1 hypothetical protein EAS64_33850 [Trebonia kvetii]
MDTALTELVEIDPKRLDGVKRPANGLPFLIMKSVAKTDPTPPTPDSAADVRANEQGATDPMSDAASKDTPVTDPTPDAPTTEDAPVEKSTEDLIAEAIAKSKAESDEALAKAMKDRDETIKGLRDEMAALRKTEIPGSPFVTNATVAKSAANTADSGDIERFERLAKSTQDRELSRYYAERAVELKARS